MGCMIAKYCFLGIPTKVMLYCISPNELASKIIPEEADHCQVYKLVLEVLFIFSIYAV